MRKNIGWIFFPVFVFIVGCSTPMVEAHEPRQVYFDSTESKGVETETVTLWLRTPPAVVYLNGIAVARSPKQEMTSDLGYLTRKPLKIKVPKGK